MYTFRCSSNSFLDSNNAAIAQVVERRIGNAEVTGSTPVSSCFYYSIKIQVITYIWMVIFLVNINEGNNIGIIFLGENTHFYFSNLANIRIW